MEKAYDLSKVCIKYGLDGEGGDDPFKSKFKYVRSRLVGKDEDFILSLAKKLATDYQDHNIGSAINQFLEGDFFQLTEISRQKLINLFLSYSNLSGNISPDELLLKSGLSHLVQADIFSGLWGAPKKKINPLIEILEGRAFYELLDSQVFEFLEILVHPIVRIEHEQTILRDQINSIIRTDDLQLECDKIISGAFTYKVVSRDGVKGKIKNLIFASNGYKPEIVIKDALNNDLEIIKNKDSVLVFEEDIPNDGLMWVDLVKWWAKVKKQPRNQELAQDLKNRLYESLDSKPEQDFFISYYKKYAKILGKNLPALIPQVYLHYDPYTVKRHGISYLLRQRMDFLMIFSHKQRVVIEIDGKQHYAVNEIASPEKYSEMIRLDRELKFLNYDVYRLGGFELTYNTDETIETFFNSIFEKYK
ncbi:MAG: hypothetical protein H6581_00025 [Bacteroidia bacterium]|nr:hypothetical protein [Bacteroidia bacterium]